ncbi:MAG: sigma-70 family RNA polymerase sigma factor [Candidatus Saganbacteria bacterium]|nr:sigma-70 family RNA polymerase sigma factor [Candidatus Saganbacteria bacterium]
MIKKKADKEEKVMPAKALEQYMPLVNAIASMVSGKGLPPSIDFNDLVSDGVIGLMKARDNFDPTRGVKFETYASYRIRGEMLDGLKNYNPVPYRVQVKIRDLAKKGYKEYAKEALDIPEKKEISDEEFRTAVSKIRKIVAASALMYLLSLEGVEEEREAVIAGENTPEEDVEFSELRRRLTEAVKGLPQQEKECVELFYTKEMSQKDIARKLKLSRSKVNRLLGRAVIDLRDKIK